MYKSMDHYNLMNTLSLSLSPFVRLSCVNIHSNVVLSIVKSLTGKIRKRERRSELDKEEGGKNDK